MDECARTVGVCENIVQDLQIPLQRQPQKILVPKKYAFSTPFTTKKPTVCRLSPDNL